MKMNYLVLSLAIVCGLASGVTVYPNTDPIINPKVIYEGMAWPSYDHDENTVMIPVEECPYGCAVESN